MLCIMHTADSGKASGIPIMNKKTNSQANTEKMCKIKTNKIINAIVLKIKFGFTEQDFINP